MTFTDAAPQQTFAIQACEALESYLASTGQTEAAARIAAQRRILEREREIFIAWQTHRREVSAMYRRLQTRGYATQTERDESLAAIDERWRQHPEQMLQDGGASL